MIVALAAASCGRRWIAPIQRPQNSPVSARRPGRPIRWPEKVSSAGSSVSELASTTSTLTEVATAMP